MLTGIATMAMAPAVIVQSASAQSALTRSDDQFQDIIVTAQRREQALQDVPISITAFSPERLEQQGIRSEKDLRASVPSLIVGENGQQGSRDTQSFTIRGQGATFQASPGVVVYLNEVPLPSAIQQSQQGGPGNFVDIESLQVLAGPQGTLFGRNTTGGAVLLVPRKPGNEFGGWLQGRIGNYDDRELEGALNIPIIDDKVMIRAVGAYHDRGGFTRDVQFNKDRDNIHWYSGRLGILLKPTERLENYTMIYGARSRNNGAGVINQGFNIAGLKAFNFCYDGPTVPGAIVSCDVYRAAAADAAALGPRKTRLSVDAFNLVKTWGVTNTTTFDLTDELKLRNIASYQRYTRSFATDFDATLIQQHEGNGTVLPADGTATLPGDGTPLFYRNQITDTYPSDRLREITEELQIQGDMLAHRLNFVIGSFYYDQQPVGLQGGGQPIIFCPAAFTGFCPPNILQGSVGQKSKALYAQATLDLGAVTPSLNGLSLTGGYRYTWDTITGYAISYRFDSANPGNVICSVTGASVGLAGAATDCRLDGRLKSSSPSWLIGLDYKVTTSLMVFAKVNRGYKAGGFNPNAVFPTTVTFDPETVTSYEGGLKVDRNIANLPVRFNASYYYLDYNNVQRATGDTNPSTLAQGARVLGAKARVQGVEVQASIRPFNGLELGGNFSYTDAKYKNFRFTANNPQIDCTGSVIARGSTADMGCLPFSYVSPYIYSIYASAERSLGNNLGKVSFFVSYSHNSAQYTSATNLPVAEPGAWLSGFGLLNATLDWNGIAGSGLDAGLFVTNATNNLYRTSNSGLYGSLLYNATLYGEPRMYGLKLRYRFGGG